MLTYYKNDELSQEQITELLESNGNWLKRIENKTLELCLIAVKSNGYAIRYVPDEYKNEEICLNAIKNNYSAMLHVPKGLNSIGFWFKAVAVNGEALKHIPKKEQTYELVRDAVLNNPCAIRFAAKRLINMPLVKLAVFIDGVSLKYIPKHFINEEIITKAIESNGLAIQFIDNPNKEYCRKAINSNPSSIEFIPEEHKTYEMCLKAVEFCGKLIEFVPPSLINQDICETAVANGAFLKNIPNKYYNKKICVTAVENCGDEILYVPKEYIDNNIISVAMKTSWKAYEFVHANDFTIDIVMDFFIAVLNEYKTKGFFLFDERDIIMEIVSKFPNSVVCSIVENDSLIKAIKILKLTTTHRKYDEKAHTFIITETFRNIEIDKTILNNFEEYYYYCGRVVLNRIHVPCFEGAENFDKATLRKYNLRYSKSTNSLVDAMSVNEDNIEKKLLNTNVDEITLPLQTENNGIVRQEHSIIVPENATPASTVYYISDIHLIHKIKSQVQSLTYDNIYNYIEQVVIKLTHGVDAAKKDINGPLLLIAGDVASDFEITNLFFSILSKHWQPEHIIAILGNHELWGFDCELDEIIKKYRQMFNELNITFLHNEILLVDRTIIGKKARENSDLSKTHITLSYNDILRTNTMSDDEIRVLFNKTSFAILGGLGFSGLEPNYNANMFLYRNAVKNLEQDKLESDKFAKVYECAIRCLKDKNVIVLTHTPINNWYAQGYRKGWIYVNGHTHYNSWKDSEDIRVYSDNQLGYKSNNYSLKHFYLKSLDYDIFEHYDDGCYVITNEQYADFNRGMHLSGDGRDGGKIHMLKRLGIYCFLFEDEQNNKLYFLRGGVINNIKNQDIEYYYNNMVTYAKMLKSATQSRQDILVNISKAVRQIGGTGTIHGSIVDIDFYNHIYLNLFDGKITPYYATSIADRTDYENIPSLLKDRLPKMYNQYIKLSPSDSNMALTKDNDKIILSASNFINTNIYKLSLIMKQIQALLEKNVIRIWNEKILDAFLQNPRLK